MGSKLILWWHLNSSKKLTLQSRHAHIAPHSSSLEHAKNLIPLKVVTDAFTRMPKVLAAHRDGWPWEVSFTSDHVRPQMPHYFVLPLSTNTVFLVIIQSRLEYHRLPETCNCCRAPLWDPDLLTSRSNLIFVWLCHVGKCGGNRRQLQAHEAVKLAI